MSATPDALANPPRTDASATENRRRIVIDPVTRVEGHGKVTLVLDDADRIQEARFHVVEFRGFERFIQGRPYNELPMVVQRLCGICPVSHHLAAAKAVDQLVGADTLPPTVTRLRRLLHFGQILQSHAVHFFHLASPDLLFGFHADAAERNIATVAEREPELARQGILLRKLGQQVIEALAGKRVHGIAVVPGGAVKGLDPADRDRLARDLPERIDWAEAAVERLREWHRREQATIRDFAAFPAKSLSLTGPDGALEFYDGTLRVGDETGQKLYDGLDPNDFPSYLQEEVKPWSYMKFPFLKAFGPEAGWYRVGPLARLNNTDLIPTPRAEAARQAFFADQGHGPVHATLAYHWARLIELLHCAESLQQLLDDPITARDAPSDLQAPVSTELRPEGIGVIEAPRGTLFHRYRVDPQGLVTHTNLIVSTTHNNAAMNRALADVATKRLAGHPTLDDGLLNELEIAIRAYDPCLSCATHAVGRMPLWVELRDADGALQDERIRGSEAAERGTCALGG